MYSDAINKDTYNSLIIQEWLGNINITYKISICRVNYQILILKNLPKKFEHKHQLIVGCDESQEEVGHE